MDALTQVTILRLTLQIWLRVYIISMVLVQNAYMPFLFFITFYHIQTRNGNNRVWMSLFRWLVDLWKSCNCLNQNQEWQLMNPSIIKKEMIALSLLDNWYQIVVLNVEEFISLLVILLCVRKRKEKISRISVVSTVKHKFTVIVPFSFTIKKWKEKQKLDNKWINIIFNLSLNFQFDHM